MAACSSSRETHDIQGTGLRRLLLKFKNGWTAPLISTRLFAALTVAGGQIMFTGTGFIMLGHWISAATKLIKLRASILRRHVSHCKGSWLFIYLFFSRGTICKIITVINQKRTLLYGQMLRNHANNAAASVSSSFEPWSEWFVFIVTRAGKWFHSLKD